MSAARPTQQKRSEATLQAIVQATFDLLSVKDIEDIGVGDIAAKAGVAVGTIYRRFENKEAVVAHLLRLVQERQVSELEKVLAPDRWQDVPVEDRVRWLRTRLTETAGHAPGLLRAIYGHVITGRDRLADYAREQDRKVLEILAGWILDAWDAETGPAERLAVTTALSSFVHGLYLAALYPFSYAGLPRDAVIGELEKALLLHLRAAAREGAET